MQYLVCKNQWTNGKWQWSDSSLIKTASAIHLGQDEDNGIMPIPPTGVNWYWGRFIHLEEKIVSFKVLVAPRKMLRNEEQLWHELRDRLKKKHLQGHQELSGKSDENKSFKSNQLPPSIYIMIELCFFSLDQWDIRIHLLWGKCFNIAHHCDPRLNQTKWLIFNDLLPLTIPGVLTVMP